MIGETSRLHSSSERADVKPTGRIRNLSVNAFHEKAGRSQGNSGFIASSCFSADKVFVPPSSHCRHASIRTLEERIRFARCMLGVLNSAGAAICLATCGSAVEQ